MHWTIRIKFLEFSISIELTEEEKKRRERIRLVSYCQALLKKCRAKSSGQNFLQHELNVYNLENKLRMTRQGSEIMHAIGTSSSELDGLIHEVEIQKARRSLEKCRELMLVGKTFDCAYEVEYLRNPLFYERYPYSVSFEELGTTREEVDSFPPTRSRFVGK